MIHIIVLSFLLQDNFQLFLHLHVFGIIIHLCILQHSQANLGTHLDRQKAHVATVDFTLPKARDMVLRFPRSSGEEESLEVVEGNGGFVGGAAGGGGWWGEGRRRRAGLVGSHGG